MWEQLTRATSAPWTPAPKAPPLPRRVSATSLSDEIVEYIAAHPGCTSIEIREALGSAKGVTLDRLGWLDRHGHIISRLRDIADRPPHCRSQVKHYWSKV